MNSTITVAQLRRPLTAYFDRVEVDTMFRALRADGLMPLGQSGHGGCRSARLDARQVALVLLALASNVAPRQAPAEAERIARFRLLRRDMTHSSEPARSVEYQNQQLSLLTALTRQIVRGVDEDYQPPGWVIGSHEAAQLDPDRLVFGDGEPADEIERQTVIGARLIGDVGTLFLEHRSEAA